MIDFYLQIIRGEFVDNIVISSRSELDGLEVLASESGSEILSAGLGELKLILTVITQEKFINLQNFL